MEIVQILDEDNFLRRVPTYLPSHIKPDGTITRAVFKPSKTDSDGLSGDVERLSSFDKATLHNNRFRLIKINVGTIRSEINDGLDVIHNPQPENDAHCLLTGKITDGKAGQLLKKSIEVTRDD
ncbi:MAG TPA: hypothetical protein PKC54_14655 [Ferruginibacter sp.]|nr:hypothetical protein [Ferruginibacter sp.]